MHGDVHCDVQNPWTVVCNHLHVATSSSSSIVWIDFQPYFQPRVTL
jgi:hypothetical protein